MGTNLDFVLAVLVLGLALLVLAYPLYRARSQPVAVNASTLDDLLAQRDGVYATLRDLETDRQLGKLDAADYTALREKYMARAADILRELDILWGQGEGQKASDEIEQEVAALRHRPSAPAKKTPTSPKSLPQVEPESRFCTNCGRPHNVGDKFCAKCGHALS